MKKDNEKLSACYASGDCVKITGSVAFIGKVGTLVERIGGKMWHVNIDGMPLKFRETGFQKHNTHRSHGESVDVTETDFGNMPQH